VLACAAVSSDPPYSHPRAPDAVRRADGMAVDGKGGFYGRDAVAKVAHWRADPEPEPEPEPESEPEPEP
jgi:hypothetical protein